MKKNIAVVGCGHWGKNLVRNFAEIGALHSVCDPDIDVAQKLSKEYGVKNSSFEDIKNNPTIEGIELAVPAPLHSSMSIEALYSNKHVYVEKPLAMNKNEAKKMIDVAKSKDLSLMVGHLLQYHPVFVRMLSLINEGLIGNVNYIYSNRLSFGQVRNQEDVIWSFAPHDISMILSIADDMPKSVKVISSCILQEQIPDNSIIHLNFNKPIKAHINVSWLHPYKEQKLVVIGQEGMLVFDDTNEWNEKLSFYNHRTHTKDNNLNLIKSDVEYMKVMKSEPLRNECLHFIEVVNEGIRPLTDGLEGMRVLEVLSAASASQSEEKTQFIVNER